MQAPATVDGLFLSYFEDLDRWHNDHAPGKPTGAPAVLRARTEEGGRSILARTARQGVSLDGKLHDISRFFAWAAHGSTAEYRRYDAFSLTHLSGAYYESLGARLGCDLVHLNHVSRVDLAPLSLRYAPRCIFLSSTFFTEIANLLDAMRHLRRAWPGVPIVVGGLFLVELEKAVPAARFQAMLSTFGADAYVVSALGEEALCRILRRDGDGLEGLELPSTWQRSGRGYTLSSAPEPGLPIDEHFVRWDELRPDGLYHTVHTRTARSCAFACSFCSYPANQGALTLAQPATLERELQHMRRAGVRSIVFTDDTFNVPMPRFRELVDVLAKFDFTWYSYFRCQYADDDIVQRMVDSGCGGAFLGFESLDDTVLKNMNKAATFKSFARGTEVLKRHNVPCHANFIIGFPGDRPEYTDKFLRFVDEHGIEFYNATPWFCSPATPIAGQKERFGVEGDYYRWRHDTMDSDQAIDLEEHAIGRARESVWITELGARNFWTELFLYTNGLTPAEAQRAVRAYNAFVGRDSARKDVAGDPEVAWLGGLLRAKGFPAPAGMRDYLAAEEPAAPAGR
jgi:p-methyltransferase